MHKNGKTEHRGGRQYGYVRVSSREQNEARQLAAMCNAGIRAEYIFADKQSGRDFDRPQYKSCCAGFAAGTRSLCSPSTGSAETIGR